MRDFGQTPSPRLARASAQALAVLVCLAGSVHAVSGQSASQAKEPTHAGPAAPTPPQTVARDEEGRTTIRTIRLLAPLKIDGRLDELIYTEN